MMMKAYISIKGSQMSSNNENDAFELMTDGEYSRENEISTFSYVESELTGFDGLLTTFDVEPDRVILRRGDSTVADMIFSEKQKHHFMYETPFGAITMGIDTHSITNDMREDGGYLEIRYNIEIDSVSVSSNLFQINVRTQQTQCPPS